MLLVLSVGEAMLSNEETVVPYQQGQVIDDGSVDGKGRSRKAEDVSIKGAQVRDT